MASGPKANEERTDPWQRDLHGSRPGQRTLVIVGSHGLDERALPARSTLTIGRDPTANIQIEDGFVSKRHAVLHVADTITLTDEGSSNGTFVNGARIPPHTALAVLTTDVIHIGSSALLFREAAPAPTRTNPHRLVSDPVMRQLYDLAATVGPSRVAVLLLGETGAGKEVLAAALHEASARGTGALVRLNCAAFSSSLLEAELFGYERGAFTGAVATKVGLLESAHKGTLFLDEIGEAPLETQAKLLRFIETGEVLRLGSVQPKFVDVRIVAATNRDLPQMVSQGEFRADLYFRLNGITLRIPPLRERRSEIMLLAEEFARQAAARTKGWSSIVFTAGARDKLNQHDWPGNVRELRATIERAVLLSTTTHIDEAALHIERLPPPMHSPRTSNQSAVDTMRVDLPAQPRPRADTLNFPSVALPPPSSAPNQPRSPSPHAPHAPHGPGDADRQAVLQALVDTAGNQSRAAALLGISRRTLLKRLDEYDVPRPRKGVPK